MTTPTLPPDADVLEALARRLGLPDFDLLLVGDGSGTVYDRPAGWACTAYDRRTGLVTTHAGAITGGTNNFAELFPYVHALWFHLREHGLAPALPVRVQIVSDSEVTVRCGEGRYARRANGCLWAAVAWFEQNGYKFGWRHVPRNSNPCNARMDSLAGAARKRMAEVLPREAAAKPSKARGRRERAGG